MGYDTTLHLVDERAFATYERMFFELQAEDEEVRKLANQLETNRAAAAIELAKELLLQVSASGPYVRDRNVALSL